MFKKLKLSDEEKKKSISFIKWCTENNKDIFKLALNSDYMKKCVEEYEGGKENEN